MYKRLEIVSYSDFDNYEIEYQKRFEGLAAIKTGLTIRPFSKKEQRRLADTYQLFYVLLPNHYYIFFPKTNFLMSYILV